MHASPKLLLLLFARSLTGHKQGSSGKMRQRHPNRNSQVLQKIIVTSD
ncbi:hypothetical protein ACQ4M4_24670 [Leptolyngbya sp. AN02str]